jgi:cell division protein FtsW
MNRFFSNIRGDKVVWMVFILLSAVSLLAVYSSSGSLAYRFQGGNTEYYLFKHLGILLFAFVLMYLAHLVKYTYYSRISQIGLYAAIPLLALTLVLGTNLNDANRWLTIPIINLTFQTSDFAKLMLIIYLARLLSKKQDEIKDFRTAFIPVMVPVVLTCALILPANFSTSALLFATSVVIMFVGRLNMTYVLGIVGIAAVLFVLMIMVSSYFPDLLPRKDTWISRLEEVRNPSPEGSYQVDQAKIAIASGGIFGKSPGKSSQRNSLPQAYSDFIFAIIIEEYGLVGGTILVLLYMILLFRGIRIARYAPGTFGALISIGLSFSLVFQAMINMMVAVNLLPVTGQPLPFVSMGGTSIWFSSLALGIILSVSRQTINAKKDDKEQGDPVVA